MLRAGCGNRRGQEAWATGVGKRRGQEARARGAAEVLPLGLGSEGAQDFLLDFPSIYVWFAFFVDFPWY
jgi:hypothetical protein